MTAGGGVVGGGLSYALFDRNPLAVVAGAAGGAALGSVLYGEDEAALTASYNEGYIKASSDSIKRQYWLKQEMEGPGNQSCGRFSYYTFPADNLTADGRMLVDHTVTVPILE
ncbi:hypothetical protein AYO37_00100 [Opitutia bacterium SCGC AG-212-L18]|nr:hypothetical protein AYO37_00100 [Opitutae bacterium SCGC AG-212-L18]